MSAAAAPAPSREARHYWNCWTNNHSRINDGYVMHAYLESDNGGRRGFTLCGASVQEIGSARLDKDKDCVSCRRCRRILKNRGVSTE